MWHDDIQGEIQDLFAIREGCIDVFHLPAGVRIDDHQDSRHRAKREAAKKALYARRAEHGHENRGAPLRCSACGAEVPAKGRGRGGRFVCPVPGCWAENEAA